DVKRVLRRQPDYFKVIITSRQQIPSGFHQIELKGLGKRDGKSLMKKLFQPYKNSSKEQLSTSQQDNLYEVTSGIPIILKHCYAQIYEYNKPFQAVLKGLSEASNKVVSFSFSEIFHLLKNNSIQTKIIILLEVVNCPLLIRQIAEILDIEELEVSSSIIKLFEFQCIKKIRDKFFINEDIRFFSKRLLQENPALAKEVQKKITDNFTIERRMDYSSEELDVVKIFEGFLLKESFVKAEDYIKQNLEDYPSSILLNFKYAKYLYERKGDSHKAIDVLEKIRQNSANDFSVLRLLIACYTSLDVPNFNQANIYAGELKVADDDGIKLELAEFFVKWSISVMNNPELDPIAELLRQKKYKELADDAIDILKAIQMKNHHHYYLLARSYYNKSNYKSASTWIERALENLPRELYYRDYRASYSQLKKEVLEKQSRFSNR
ncbi:MAG: hypothetical protein AAF572_17320, partial [Cyanobacteria bacterium P01_B01_bin.77]